MADCTDVLVVGGGFAGLTAAVFAARQGLRVRVISRGQGALAVGGGTIDLLGYVPGRAAAVRYPLRAVEKLGADHPYRLAGGKIVREALCGFLKLCTDCRYPYAMDGELDDPRNIRLFTTVGTMKPSCLVPSSMAMLDADEAKEVLVVGMEGLKDFFPHMAAEGIARFLPGRVTPVQLSCPGALSRQSEAKGASLRDLSTLDAARFLDAPDGRSWFVDRLRRTPAFAALRQRGGAILMPPVLGSRPSCEVREALSCLLECPVYELIGPPPGVTGLRLRTLLLAELRRLGVDLVMNALAVRPEYSAGAEGSLNISAMLAESAGRLTRWKARTFIMATGGVYGGGILVQPTKVADRIFGEAVSLAPELTPVSSGWSEAAAYPDFAVGTGHAFARLGVRADADFRPLLPSGASSSGNVFFAGRALSGYDPAAEKSGNGTALVSAYAAAVCAGRYLAD